jgi:hypothetical protein
MQPPHISQVLSSSDTRSAVEIVVFEPFSASVIAETPSISSQ